MKTGTPSTAKEPGMTFIRTPLDDLEDLQARESYRGYASTDLEADSPLRTRHPLKSHRILGSPEDQEALARYERHLFGEDR